MNRNIFQDDVMTQICPKKYYWILDGWQGKTRLSLYVCRLGWEHEDCRGRCPHRPVYRLGTLL